MTVINTNIKAMVTTESLRSNNLRLANAMERLSTGVRINSAKDDAAGLSIATRMTSQMRGFSMATRNANDAISMAQIADGAYGQVVSILQRMRELAVQAATGSQTANDRESIAQEVRELQTEIDKISERTNFNGIKLLDGTAERIQIQTGAFEGNQITIGFGSVQIKDIGQGEAPALTSLGGLSTTFAAFQAGDLVLNGTLVGASLGTDDQLSTGTTAQKASSAIAKVAAINRVSDFSGVTARVNDTRVLGTSMVAAATSGSVTINGHTTAVFSTSSDAATSRINTVRAINDISGASGVRAIDTGDDSQGILLVAADGRNIDLSLTGLTQAATGLGTTGVYVGTYSVYGMEGRLVQVDHQVGKSVTDFARTGLQLGGFAPGQAQITTAARGPSTAGAAPGAAVTGVLSGNTLVINDIIIDAARATDDTASFATTASAKASSAIAIAAAINAKTDKHTVRASAQANVLRGSGATAFVSGGNGTLSLNGVDITVSSVSRNTVLDTINQFTGQTGVVAREYGIGIELVAADGRNIVIASDLSAANLGLAGVAIGSGTTAGTAVAHYANVVLGSDKAFLVARGSEGGANFETLGFRVGLFGGLSAGEKVAELDVTTQRGAGIAITIIDAAIDRVSALQGRAGAYQNRLDAIVTVLSEQIENTSASRSRVLDTDYAVESTNLAKAQIVAQAATAMLAQANQSQQTVLQLLQ